MNEEHILWLECIIRELSEADCGDPDGVGSVIDEATDTLAEVVRQLKKDDITRDEVAAAPPLVAPDGA